MISRSARNKIISRVSATTVLLALITLSVLQYKWVVSSAEKDLEELYRSFSYRIHASISEQFSFFPILGDRLGFLKGISNEEDLQNNIVDFFRENSKTEGFSYFSSISYVIEKGNEKRYLVYSETGWDENKSAPEIMSDERRRFNMIPDPDNRGIVWLSIPLPPVIKESKMVILFRFDILAFYKNEIEKSLWNENDNYELEWYYDFTGKFQNRDKKDYTYSPFRVLKEKLFSSERSWLIEIPLHVIVFNDEENRMAKIFIDHGKQPDGVKPVPMVYIDVLYKGKPLIKSKEYNLTVQWLLSLMLILGIGIAYIVILYQIYRLKQMRLREKEFVASVTHELRTPLTVIHSAADNIKSGIISPGRIEKYGHLITEQSTRLSSMIEGILLFSRLEGKAEQPPVLNEIDFNQLEEDLAVYCLSLNHSDRIDIDLCSLPPNAITDKNTLELILTNLINNSYKHAYEKNDIGKIRVVAHLQLPHFLIFTVEDDGSGIDKSEQRHIFEPFYRGKKSLKNQTKGSGLGLYLSYRKAKLLGGSLKVESPYERADGKIRNGSRFILKLPYMATEQEQV